MSVVAVQLILYLSALAGGVWLAKSRNRWIAFFLCLVLSWLGFVLAYLFLKKRCPYCAEYMYPSAKVCPHCGRNWNTGDVTVSKISRRALAALVAFVCASALAEGPALQERLEERARLQAELEGAKAELASSREGRTLNQRRRVVELTDSEKALDLDSFAGFSFGAELSDLEVAKGRALSTPFRAFTRVQLMRTDFAHRLYCVRLTSDIGDWSAQSVSNEVAFLRGMLSDQYGISSWQTSAIPRRVCKFENGNISISITTYAKWLSLEVTNRRVLAEDERACEAAKTRVVEFHDSQGFAALEHVASELPEPAKQ